jgi:5-methylcytosine-specific restriction endonuclease McrA
MLANLLHHLDYHLRKLRSPEWRHVERTHLLHEPRCQACGTSYKPQVHHIAPFHLHPELELVEVNLITLCMSGNECHLKIGHLGNWRGFNPRVRLDAANALRQKAAAA